MGVTGYEVEMYANIGRLAQNTARIGEKLAIIADHQKRIADATERLANIAEGKPAGYAPLAENVPDGTYGGARKVRQDGEEWND